MVWRSSSRNARYKHHTVVACNHEGGRGTGEMRGNVVDDTSNTHQSRGLYVTGDTAISISAPSLPLLAISTVLTISGTHASRVPKSTDEGLTKI